MAHGISPDRLWQMTPAEVLAGLGAPRSGEEQALSSSVLAALMQEHDAGKAETQTGQA